MPGRSAVFLRRVGRGLRRAAAPLLYHGTGRFCPLCGKSSRRFLSYGTPVRQDAQCPRCGSLERHRLLWLYLKNRSNLFDGVSRDVLHVAPERILESRFKQLLGKGYLTADLYNPRAMVRMDIANIDRPDHSFDIVYCSHVLEHVPDDRRAIREFNRILRPGGWAMLLVPITVDKTFEDPSVTDPAERLRLFGQVDHVRRYGPDFADRLREGGFQVQVMRAGDLADAVEARRTGLVAGGELFYCAKQP